MSQSPKQAEVMGADSGSAAVDVDDELEAALAKATRVKSSPQPKSPTKGTPATPLRTSAVVLEAGAVLRGDDLEIKLIKEIGEGSFAKVFEAVEADSDLAVAAKIFNEGANDAAGQAKRAALAKHEFNVVGFLNHENIVRVHGLVTTGTTVCIVQELVTGGDLFGAVLEDYGLPARQVVNVMQGIGSALRYLHDDAVGLVHLDIKPENVLMTDRGEPKLCDFDTAMKIGDEPTTMRGTPEYQAPECIPGGMEYHALISSSDEGGFPLHPSIDVWAYGLLVYFVMFGAYAWGQAIGDDPKYDAFQEGEHIAKEIPWKYMPSSLILFFNRALDARRDRRASVAELLAYALEENYEEDITAMRQNIKDEKVPGDSASKELRTLNQSDNWETSVEDSGGGFYRIKVIPPRENDTSGRVDTQMPFKRLSTLNKILQIQYPISQSENPQFTRPFAPFPPSKLFGGKSAAFLNERLRILDSYFRISFTSMQIAEFWYTKLLETMAQEVEAKMNRK